MVILMNSHGNQRKSFCGHEINSDGDFYHFMSNISKTWFSIIPIKTAVHRARNIRLCGRHRFSRIFSMRKFPAFSHWNHLITSCWQMHVIIMIPACYQQHSIYHCSKPIILLFKPMPILSACIAFNADCTKNHIIENITDNSVHAPAFK